MNSNEEKMMKENADHTGTSWHSCSFTTSSAGILIAWPRWYTQYIPVKNWSKALFLHNFVHNGKPIITTKI